MKYTEQWECDDCGLPCRVEIEIEESDTFPTHLKGNQRFRNMSCFVGESHNPHWKRIDKKINSNRDLNLSKSKSIEKTSN